MLCLRPRRLLVALAVLVIAGCATSGTGTPPASKKEAAHYNMQLGISYLRQGDLKAAQEKLERAIADDGTLATAYSALGLVYERLGDINGAEKNYRRAVSLAPADPDALNALGVFLCLQRQETTEALRYFDRALAVPLSRAAANRAMLNTNAGLCAKRIDLPRAERYLRNALVADAGFREALVQLADVAYAQGNYLQSRAFVERYLASGQATPDALWLGVQAERALGEAQAAADYAQQLRTQFPESVELRLLLESERDAGRQ